MPAARQPVIVVASRIAALLEDLDDVKKSIQKPVPPETIL